MRIEPESLYEIGLKKYASNPELPESCKWITPLVRGRDVQGAIDDCARRNPEWGIPENVGVRLFEGRGLYLYEGRK